MTADTDTRAAATVRAAAFFAALPATDHPGWARLWAAVQEADADRETEQGIRHAAETERYERMGQGVCAEKRAKAGGTRK